MLIIYIYIYIYTENTQKITTDIIFHLFVHGSEARHVGYGQDEPRAVVDHMALPLEHTQRLGQAHLMMMRNKEGEGEKEREREKMSEWKTRAREQESKSNLLDEKGGYFRNCQRSYVVKMILVPFGECIASRAR